MSKWSVSFAVLFFCFPAFSGGDWLNHSCYDHDGAVFIDEEAPVTPEEEKSIKNLISDCKSKSSKQILLAPLSCGSESERPTICEMSLQCNFMGGQIVFHAICKGNERCPSPKDCMMDTQINTRVSCKGNQNWNKDYPTHNIFKGKAQDAVQ